MNNKSVYIHIPFCNNICSYCDFYKVYYDPKWLKKYLLCLKNEIEDIYMNEEIESIYIGGGTPSCLKKNELEELFQIVNLLNKKNCKEFTFECNLNDISEYLLILLKENGVNRLSIGIESFNKQKLGIMKRNHNFKEAKEKINMCRNYGFDNINIDFIYGFAFENPKITKKDLKQILKLKPDHISTYSLMIENNTLLKVQNYQKIDEDMDYKLYKMICKLLKKKNFEHYEVSNFALKNKKSIHNLRYWENKEYYGFGLSASGYIDKVRYTNTYSLTKYLNNDYTNEKYILTKKDIMDNHMILGLRLLKGINLKEFEDLYQVKMEDVYPIKPLVRNKDLVIKKGNIFVNLDKLYIMNEILIKMI